MDSQVLPTADGLTEKERRLWERKCQVVFKVRLSVLYHLKRERFFDSIDKWVSMVIAVSATAAVGTILKKSEGLDLYTAAFTAILALIPLVFNPAEKAREHSHAASEFRRLLAECETLGDHWPEDHCNRLAGKFVELEAGEASPLSALVAECQNQMAIAAGDKPPVHLKWHQRRLKNIWDFDAAVLAEQKA